MSFATDAPDGCTLALRVHPGAKRDAIAGLHDGQLKVSLTPPPTDGRANEALIRLLAERLGIPRNRISLIAGASSRSKAVRVQGLSAAEAVPLLLFNPC
jgi:uncharacterized protein (TIGR00251 family)